jgi:hypothetical protein
MTLDEWIRSREPRMTDAEFGRIVGERARGQALTQQAVGMWRRGERMPDPQYIPVIENVTERSVMEIDLLTAWRNNRAKHSNGVA